MRATKRRATPRNPPLAPSGKFALAELCGIALEERTCDLAVYIIDNRITVRAAK